ncbi:MAG: 23S rRNA (adenine(2030)-N(6))-methyltransferase RlmJ [Alphaproteobacteria bacterium]|nr:23S rRNA (adenine(2030)-N(6))-methyltransferase RlmJ [Alphaproteobacteria bacterium]
MLSYQHIYHAGCLADVHKHASLCILLETLTAKDKPLTYLETHAGRGLYDLNSLEAQKTGEAAAGILRIKSENRLPAEHPYTKALAQCEKQQGPNIYPGSAALAAALLRQMDKMHLMELHPQEILALQHNMKNTNAQMYQRDGYEGLLALSPPTPRRGLVFIDPSYEIKTEYQDIPRHIEKLVRKWNVAVIAIWYPLLPANNHKPMLERLQALNLPKSFTHEVTFPPANEGHGMIGSGMFYANIPFGVEENLKTLENILPQRV